MYFGSTSVKFDFNISDFSFFLLQRTSNVENSTYDLYAIPKDSDSKNPDGKVIFRFDFTEYLVPSRDGVLILVLVLVLTRVLFFST